MKKQLLNLNSHDAYTALGYAAGRFKVTVESSQVHTRLATFRQNCGRFKTETPVGIWFMRAHNDETDAADSRGRRRTAQRRCRLSRRSGINPRNGDSFKQRILYIAKRR